MAAGNSKAKRKPKRALGIHGGGGRVRDLTPVELVLLGRGQYRTFKPVGSVRHELAPTPVTEPKRQPIPAALRRSARGVA